MDIEKQIFDYKIKPIRSKTLQTATLVNKNDQNQFTKKKPANNSGV